MKTFQQIDIATQELDPEVRASVYKTGKLKIETRQKVLARDFGSRTDKIRETAGLIKQHTLEHLDQYLEQAERVLIKNGVKVHFAADAKRANDIVFDIMRCNNATKVVKSKSMVSEEIGLVPYLESNGMEAVETDLGEFIIQIDDDHPSHIVSPIIHKNRRQIAKSFEREGLGDYNDDPSVITRRARKHLRNKFMLADVGITGANLVSAESGRIVLLTNEGNARFSMAPARIHIAIVGVEKLVPRDRDLAVFLNILTRSSTGQQLTVYTEFICGPRNPGQKNGPEQMHVIFLDNKRTEVLASECREILRCIRCGACLNVCPVYRQAGGHAYRSVYPGPLGAVLSPLLAGEQFPQLADLPKASSLCGACHEVCPVNIPIPDLLLRLRNKGKEMGVAHAQKGTPDMTAWSLLATHPTAWNTALQLGHAMNYTPESILNSIPSASAWLSSRSLPEFRGGQFRKWMKKRK